jgi:Fe-S-cluster containining protein
MPEFVCRPDCGACCIALSISSAIPGMPRGKASGETCCQLDGQLRCRIFGESGRPACCAGLKPSREMCGDSREAALEYLYWLEAVTRPEAEHGQ